MEDKHKTRKRWVRRFAIVFFTILLLLTFFSNTIMNHSLPQVSTQSIESDSVSTKVRGSGVVEAGEAKNIIIAESREITEILVKEGDVVKKGDVIIRLKEGQSTEITTAEEELTELKDAYNNGILVNEIEQSLVTKAENGGNSYESNRATLTALSNKVKDAQARVDTIQAQINQISGNTTTQNQGNSLNDDAIDGEGDTGISSDAGNEQNSQITELSKSLETAQAELQTATKEHDDFLADINTVNGLKSQYEAIVKAQASLDKLKQSAIGNEVTASVDGTILSVDAKVGDTTTPELPVATIQGNTNGNSLSFSVTNEQAKKVTVGDEASISNSWYYGDVTVKLSGIKNDPSSAGKQKILVFSVTGDIEAGETMSLSLGNKSSTYDYVVPNSAVREDNNGKFILIVKQKSSPLGNRYIASRVDVEVIVTDDSKTAVKGALEGGENVITTSNKMIKTGDLVRLAD